MRTLTFWRQVIYRRFSYDGLLASFSRRRSSETIGITRFSSMQSGRSSRSSLSKAGNAGAPRSGGSTRPRTARSRYKRNAAVETFEVHDGGGAIQPAIGRLRGNVLPGRGPKHVGVFLALGDTAARDVWFFGHEDERFGENVAIAPGPRRDRGGRRRESDGIAAPARPAGVRRTRASGLRRLFRGAISGNQR